jgi:integrase
MASIKFLVQGKKNPSKISLRFSESREFNTIVATPLQINPQHFSKALQKVRNIVEAENKDEINNKLRKLKTSLIDRYNEDVAEGIFINTQWVKEEVYKFFNHTPKENKNYKIFLLDYIQYFIKNCPERYSKKLDQESRPISERTIQKYRTCQKLLQEFSDKEGKKIKLVDIDLSFYKRFVAFLRTEKKYNDNTIGKYIATFKTVLNDAVLNNIAITPQIKNFKVYTASTKDVYLNEDEIEEILNYNFNQNLRLKNARDLFIIGLRTGLRVSDFTRLKDAEIDGDFITIETFKQGKPVTIPIHPQLKTILENGLPRPISEQKLNLYLKEICKNVGIEDLVEGAKMNPETKRKEKGIFPKYELISTHTCRRSFASNLYGKVPNHVIMAITGHTKESTFLKYIKITPKENAMVLQAYWEKTIPEDYYQPSMKIS